MKSIAIAALAILLMAACKKNTDSNGSDPNECVTGKAITDGNIISGRYIVAYNNDLTARMATDATIARVSSDVLMRNSIAASVIKEVFAGEPGGFIAELSDEQAARLAADPNIKAVEHDRIIKLGGCFTVAEPRLITWNVNRVGYGDGTGKTAWIIDTGIDMDHPDLNVDATRSKSFISGKTPDDENGHGTHVAGIIGGKNNTIGVLGVASGANLVSLRVLDGSGEGTLSAIVQALSYINTNGKAGDVVNMSLGEDTLSAVLNLQVQNTSNRGIYFAIAAGNDGQPANKFSPANANGTNIFTVSAIDSLDNFASFSNYGNDVVDYAAPGVHILSTFFNNRYAYLSGTSMATPHIAGLLLLRGRNLNTSGTAKNDPDGVPDPIAHY
jgi:subtilisin family serine protease